MSEDSKGKSASGGISFAGLLTIVFIVLKLTGTIAWSWFWVFSPVILIPVIILAIIVITSIITAIIAVAAIIAEACNG